MDATKHIELISIDKDNKNDVLFEWNCSVFQSVRFYQVIQIDDDKNVSFLTNIEDIKKEYDIEAWFDKATPEITTINKTFMSKIYD